MKRSRGGFGRRLASALMSAAVLLGVGVLGVPLIAEKTSFNVSAAQNVTINSQNVSLYYLEDWAKDYISMPSQYKQSFQLSVSGASNVSYSTVGASPKVQVSSTGLITPRITYFYWYGNIGYSYRLSDSEPDEITADVSYGETTVRVVADGKTFDVKVNLLNYARAYADKVIDDYLAANVTSNMTTEEKLNKIAKFVADREYSVRYQSYTGLIVSGGGDCWASTNTIIEMADRIGLDAWSRNGNRDLGAGSGHMNAMVYDGTNYYEVEAGYYQEAPRDYSVKKRSSLFSISYNSTYSGYEVYQYDGKTEPETLHIPSSVDNKTIVSVARSFINGSSTLKRVVLPSTLKNISPFAFCNNPKLERINIPSSVEEIQEGAFCGCPLLTEFNISGSTFDYRQGGLYKYTGRWYTSETKFNFNGSVTTMVEKILISVPNASELEIQDGISEIAPYAFYHNSNITSLTIPESVMTLGEGCFGDTKNLVSINIKGLGLKKIDPFAFAYCGVRLITIPESVTFISDLCGYYNDDLVFAGVKGSLVESFASDNDRIFVDAYGTEAYSLSLDKASFSLKAGENKRLKLTVLPATVNDPVKWYTSNSSVAAVSQDGVVTAKGEGKAQITVISASGKRAKCIVKVSAPPFANTTKISASKLTLGESFMLTASSSGGSDSCQYAVFYKKASSTKWTCAQKYKTNTSVNITPKNAVSYDVRVKAKDSKGRVANKDFSVTVTKELKNISTLNRSYISPGSRVIVRNRSTGGEGDVQYAVFYKQKSQTKWTCVQSYKYKADTFITPKAATDYTVRVKARDSSGNEVKKDLTLHVGS